MPIATKKKNHLKAAYNDLNDAKKALLRISFSEEFDYDSEDSFHKKKNQVTTFYKNEKKWLADFFDTTVNELFPEN